MKTLFLFPALFAATQFVPPAAAETMTVTKPAAHGETAAIMIDR
jgi:hypothetical protein